ncbi:MAG: phosphoribosylamine--glycine ligase [Armatimonadota bacterium]
MKLLVVGSGGREHTLVWKLASSENVSKIYCAPGNAGIADCAECVDIDAEDIDSLAAFAAAQAIDLTVVGPERPLIQGIADEFERRGLPVFGPSAAGARLEGSKAFADGLMEKYSIPSAKFAVFDNPQDAKSYVESVGAPIVVKADGDAAGKGVVVAQEVEQALEAIEETMVQRIHGPAGDRVVIEECLVGPECSIKVFTDGESVVPMVPSQDHKRAYDDDQGPNTGGMGCYAPVPALDAELFDDIMTRIMEPTVKAMAQEGTPYKGVLYGGLILTDEGPKALEFNCRFGDPETQVALPLLESDLAEVLLATAEGRLSECQVQWSDRKCVCVVMASGGYPGEYQKGLPISGTEEVGARDDVVVFHAGTARSDGQLVTAGGRVLGVTALGDTFDEAIDRAYSAVDGILFDDVHFRRDIAKRALA